MTRVSKMTSLFAFGVAGLFAAGAAQAAVVDFQESATGTQGNEPGALVFDQTLSNDTASSQTFTDGLGAGNDLTVSVTPDNHRVANNAIASGAFAGSALHGDGIGDRGSSSTQPFDFAVDLTAAAGTYDVTFYLFWSDSATGSSSDVDFYIGASDTSGTADASTVATRGPSPAAIPSVSGQFVSDGSATTFGFESTNNKGFILTGFEIALVPEPASLALMGLGGLLMLGRSRRQA